MNGASFRFNPAVIVENETVNVLITLDISGHLEEDIRNVSSFVLYAVDSDSGDITSVSLLSLMDDGSSIHSDIMANDSVFTNVLAVRSAVGGERFSYRVIRIISGVENRSSGLVRTAFNAIRSYTEQSGIGDQENSNGSFVISMSSINNLELFVSYTWPRIYIDLDTQTLFESQSVGFSCGGSASYLIFISGGDTSAGGTEQISVALGRAYQDGVWTNSTMVQFFAGCHGGSFSARGPATLRLTLRNTTNGDEVLGTALSQAINPGQQFGCSSTLVGRLVVQLVDARFRFSLTYMM